MTTEFNILDAQIGAPDDGRKTLTVTDVGTETVMFEGTRKAKKVVLTCQTLNGDREYRINEAWNTTRKGNKVQGLWIQLDDENKLVSNSVLGRLLAYHKVNSANELKGKTVTGHPDPEGYTVLTTFDIDKEESKKDSIFEKDQN